MEPHRYIDGDGVHHVQWVTAQGIRDVECRSYNEARKLLTALTATGHYRFNTEG